MFKISKNSHKQSNNATHMFRKRSKQPNLKLVNRNNKEEKWRKQKLKEQGYFLKR